MLHTFTLTAALAEEFFKGYLNDNPLQATAYHATLSIDEAGFDDAFAALVHQHIQDNRTVLQFYHALPDFISTRYLQSTKWIEACLAGKATY